MKAHILQKLNDLKDKSGKTLYDAERDLGYSKSTISRWHKGESNPDLEQLTNLVEYYGGDMTDLFAVVGKHEMIVTEKNGYQGAEVIVEHYEQRLLAKDEKYQLLKDHLSERVNEMNENHKRAVDYLLYETERLKSQLDVVNQTAADLAKAASSLAGKKHIVFLVLAGANVLLAILLLVALSTGPIL